MAKKIFNKKHLLDFRKRLRQQSTRSESIVWYRLRGKELGGKFRRQHSIGNYIVDFYCAPIKLVIELDGLTHEDPRVHEHDMKKERYLKSQGCVVLRFSDDEVRDDLEGVLESIYQESYRLSDSSP